MKYFENIDYENFFEYLNKDYTYYAHRKKENSKEIKELLIDHINLSDKYFLKILNAKNLENIFINIENECLSNFSKEAVELFRKALLNTVHFHDIGKILVKFQKLKMENENVKDIQEVQDLGSNHSLVSAVLYINNFVESLKEIKSREEKKILRLFIYSNAYIISKHHSNLDSFDDFLEKFNEFEDAYNIVDVFKNNESLVYKKNLFLKNKDGKVSDARIFERMFYNREQISKNLGLAIYTYQRLLMSLVFASDFYATSEFMNGIEVNNFGEIDDINKFYNIYKNTDIYKSIKKYENESYGKRTDFSKEKNINILRTEMFLDSEKSLKQNINENVLYLEAPTGCGKSNVSMNLSFKMIENEKSLKKIYYIYPFNTLVEQNKVIIDKIFGNDNKILDQIAVVNSITPIKINDIKKESDKDYEYLDLEDFNKYSKAFLDRQFLNYPFILTTSVGIFNTMFSSKKEDIFPFHQLANSILVLDEIQSYKISIWTEIITFLKTYAKLLNIKVIIMSATLPNLNLLVEEGLKTVNLIENREKYFNNHLFSKRVKVNYNLMDSTFEDLLNHILESSKKKKKILVEFIKKATAYDFFEKLGEKFKENNSECEIALLTGDDNSIDRGRVIQHLNSKLVKENGIVLISTQIIEAGVDIDMDIGYKDSSKVDSEEQFMGRINRSCKNEGIVYFFNIDEAQKIYKKDVRTYNSLTINSNINGEINQEIRDVLIDKNFNDYYKKVLDEIKNKNKSLDEDINIDTFFEKSVCNFNFKNIEKRMKIIDDDMLSKSIFLAREIIDLNGNVITGSEVWRCYKNLLMDNKMDYSEKKIKLSQVTSKMSYFIYKIPKNSDIAYNEQIGDILYIEEGEKYFKDGKLNVEMFKTGIGDFI